MQDRNIKDKNYFYFKSNLDLYKSDTENIDTYKNIRNSINFHTQDISSLVDIGAGGVFDYDTKGKHIKAVDLFLDEIDISKYPQNITFINGDALNLPFNDNSEDNILISFLIHHLVGNTIKENYINMKKCIYEAYRVLRNGGKFILVESCIPSLFLNIEKVIYTPLLYTFSKFMSHPLTFQFTHSEIYNTCSSIFPNVYEEKIPLGKYILMYGKKIPSIISPCSVYIYVCIK